MKIIGIKDKQYNNNSLDIILDLSFDPDKGHRWELIQPQAVIRYSTENGVVQNIELIDNGQDVHGFEFKSNEIKEIENYLKQKID